MTPRSTTESGTDATRQRIMEAATRLFGRVGYARATTRAIAAEAGVNEVTLFRHFGSKKGLLLACAENFVASGFAATFEQHLTGDYAGDILAMARAQAADMAERFDLVRLLLCDASEVPEIREIVLSTSGQNQTLIADYFRRQIERGVVRSEFDPDALAAAFDSLFSAQVFLRTIFQVKSTPGLPPETIIRQFADIFVQGTIRQQEKA